MKYSWIPSMVPFCRAFAEGGRGTAALSTGFILSTPFRRHHWTCTFLFGASSVNKKQFWTVSFNASGLCKRDIVSSPEKHTWPCRLWIAPVMNTTIKELLYSIIRHWNKCVCCDWAAHLFLVFLWMIQVREVLQQRMNVRIHHWIANNRFSFVRTVAQSVAQ